MQADVPCLDPLLAGSNGCGREALLQDFTDHASPQPLHLAAEVPAALGRPPRRPPGVRAVLTCRLALAQGHDVLELPAGPCRIERGHRRATLRWLDHACGERSAVVSTGLLRCLLARGVLLRES